MLVWAAGRTPAKWKNCFTEQVLDNSVKPCWEAAGWAWELTIGFWDTELTGLLDVRTAYAARLMHSGARVELGLLQHLELGRLPRSGCGSFKYESF